MCTVYICMAIVWETAELSKANLSKTFNNTPDISYTFQNPVDSS